MSLLTGKNYIVVPRATTTERLALTPANGMLVYDTTLNAFYKYENGAWGAFGGGAVSSVFGRTGAVVAQSGDYSKSDVGLANVDNTSDANKPVSTATQTQLDLKQDKLLISEATASNSATIDFTLPSGYKSFEIRVISLIPSTDNVGMWIRVSTDGGATFAAGASDYRYQRNIQVDTTPTLVVSANDTKIITLGAAIGNGVGRYFNAFINVFDPSNASTYKNIQCELYSYNSAGAFSIGFVNGVYQSTTAINAIRILMSSGNIASGTFELWGYK